MIYLIKGVIQQLNKYRIVLRFNKYYFNAKQSEQIGGCAIYRTHEREIKQTLLLQKKWGSQIVQFDINDRSHKSSKSRKYFDYNPVIRVPIKGI